MTTTNTNATVNNAQATKVLWFSRHNMTEDQLADLRRIFGNVTINHVNTNADDVNDILEAGKEDDVLAVVLPPALLAQLTNPRVNQKPVIRAIANRQATGKKVINPATGKEEDEFMFVHDGWEKVIKVEVITERL